MNSRIEQSNQNTLLDLPVDTKTWTLQFSFLFLWQKFLLPLCFRNIQLFKWGRRKTTQVSLHYLLWLNCVLFKAVSSFLLIRQPIEMSSNCFCLCVHQGKDSLYKEGVSLLTIDQVSILTFSLSLWCSRQNNWKYRIHHIILQFGPWTECRNIRGFWSVWTAHIC